MEKSWRTSFWRYLQHRQGEKLIVGELVSLFADEVPLHHATRLWLNRGTFTGVRPRPAELSTPLRMRRHTITLELRRYPLLWSPALGRRRSITDDDVVVPQTRLCLHCGGPYFAASPTTSCGRSCARKRVWELKRAAGEVIRGGDGRYAEAVP